VKVEIVLPAEADLELEEAVRAWRDRGAKRNQ